MAPQHGRNPSADRALPHRLEQADTGGNRDVETAHRAGHRQLGQIVAMFAGQASHAGTFGAHDDDRRHPQVDIVQQLLGLAGRTHDPETALLQLLERTRQIVTATRGTVSAAPQATLRTVGDRLADLSRGMITACAPAASALRRQAPRLCGSVTPSSTSSKGTPSNLSSRCPSISSDHSWLGETLATTP